MRDAFFVKPIRENEGQTILFYNTSSGEITYKSTNNYKNTITTTTNPVVLGGARNGTPQTGSISIGDGAAYETQQGPYNIAIGQNAGRTYQGKGYWIQSCQKRTGHAIAIGRDAGMATARGDSTQIL